MIEMLLYNKNKLKKSLKKIGNDNRCPSGAIHG